jgi:hypothetical protein
MSNVVKARFCPGPERGITDAGWFRTTSLFNADRYINPDRECFESLYLLNEEFLAAGRHLVYESAENAYVLIIPLAGHIKYTGLRHNACPLEPGDVLLVPAARSHSYSIVNLGETDAAAYLQIGIRSTDDLSELKPQLRKTSVSPAHSRMFPVFDERDPFPFLLEKGQYASGLLCRKDWGQSNQHVFVYVLRGAMEIDGQLLHTGDAFGLRHANRLQWEVLSADARFLLLSFPIPGSKPDLAQREAEPEGWNE